MRAIILITLLVTACARPVATAAIGDASAHWCFAARVRHLGSTRIAIGCFSDRGFCHDARATAIRYGRLAGAQKIGDCAWR